MRSSALKADIFAIVAITEEVDNTRKAWKVIEEEMRQVDRERHETEMCILSQKSNADKKIKNEAALHAIEIVDVCRAYYRNSGGFPQ